MSILNKKNALTVALVAGLGLTATAVAFTITTNNDAAPVLVATMDILNATTDIGINEVFTVTLTGDDLILGRTTGFTITPPAAVTVSGYPVTFDAPICLSAKAVNQTSDTLPIECIGSASLGALCYWTTWDITARVNDTKTGASAVIHQGVRVLAGQNAAVASCGV